jgi:CheY-like chemotaxis protein
MPDDPQGPLHGCRVLVVEDDWFVADDLQAELSRCGAEVLGPVPSVAEALDLLVHGVRPTAALLDVRLGDEEVYPLADLLRRLEVPIVFATAQARRSLPGAYAQAPFCGKPIEPRRLVRALEGVAGR